MQSSIRFSAVVVAILAVAISGGCATDTKTTTIRYTYEPRFSFPESKTYRWEKAIPGSRRDALVESNVRFLADRQLEAKGLTSKTGQPDLLVWIGYDFEYYSGFELRALTLNISRADDNALVWRGVATGSIKTDAASDDLKNAVDGMLANFPPK